ncbi:hypothetical protein GCM10010218_06580 [Streptomyces mashuensis]|uniref:Uncharacterized protein n=1 Tax=Streptomyces mashuensis TaxID=33904 RepID=A0A919AW90_9ACTN|nr:hypothetical protein GCM10010218_06580 [Streptomyces mashuensis]
MLRAPPPTHRNRGPAMPGTQFPFSRYVALGDGDDVTGLRGWADRLAEHMARHNSGLV